MTDRIKGLVVLLSEDFREDDVEPIMEAIRMIKGVAGVTNSVCNPDDWRNREKIRREYIEKLKDIIFPLQVKK